jgi:hypothetical protein
MPETELWRRFWYELPGEHTESWYVRRVLSLAPGHCDGKSARMRISELLDNSAAIASFGLPLEPLQRILYAILERLATKFFEYPPQPTWRESEVSAKLHATGGGIDSCAGNGCIVDGA